MARPATRFVAVRARLDAPVGNVVVTGLFRKVGGPPGGGYGLIVRDQAVGPGDGLSQDGQFVVLEVGDRGDFGIWRRDGNRWIDLIPWTRTEVVRPGGDPNQLVVESIGSALTFIVNGVQVARVNETGSSRGGVGIFVGGDFNSVVLNRLTVQTAE
jgi:hypothetical protein